MSLFDNLKNMAESALEKGKELAGDAMELAQEGIEKAKDVAGDVVETVQDKISDLTGGGNDAAPKA